MLDISENRTESPAQGAFAVAAPVAAAGVSRQARRAAFRHSVKSAAFRAGDQFQKTASLAAWQPNAQTVDTVSDNAKRQEARKARRLKRFAHKSKAARLLRGRDAKLGKRIADCCYVSHSGDVRLIRKDHASGDRTAFFGGLVTCGSVWSCPVCSARISAQRAAEMNHLLAWARKSGHSVVMLTLTARHSRETELVPFLDAMKRAGRMLRQSRKWRGLDFVGSVAAQEVTHSFRNGWHVHGHWLLILPASAGDPIEAVETLRDEWSRSLGKVGLTGNRSAFHVQNGSAAGDYIAKFGAAEELALGHVKQGRGGSRTPFQLLEDADAGDGHAGELFVEYSLAFKGRRQLVWSRGLKALCGVNEVADDEIDDLSADDPVVTETVMRVWSGSSDGWRLARKRMCAMLDAVESGDCLDAAEFGPRDRDRWRAELDAAQVLE